MAHGSRAFQGLLFDAQLDVGGVAVLGRNAGRSRLSPKAAGATGARR